MARVGTNSVEDHATAHEGLPLPDAAQRLRNELQVHQSELQLQNEELRATQAELETSQARYRNLYDGAPVGYVTLQAQGRILEANLTLAGLLGVARETLFQQSFSRYLLAQDQGVYCLFIKHLRDSGASHTCEVRLVRPHAVPFWARLEAAVVPEGMDVPVFNVVVSDITRHKHEESLQAARSRLLLRAIHCSLDELLEETLNEVEALTGSLIGFYHFVDPDQESLTLQNWSTRTKKEFCRAAGKGAHYAIAKAGVWVDCIHQRQPVIHNDYAALPHKKGMPPGHAAVSRELVVPVLRGDRIVAILGVGNKPDNYEEPDVKLVSMFADLAWEIADRKRTEEALRESEAKHRAILQTAMDGFWVLDAQGRLVEVSATYCRMTGYRADELLNMRLADLEVVESEGEAVAHIARIMTRGEDRFESRQRRKDGSIFDVEVSVQCRPGDNAHLVAFLRDITERKRAEIRDRLARQVLFLHDPQVNHTDTLRRILQMLRTSMDMEAVGIRLRDGDDFPYYESSGFPEPFLQQERHLCARDAAGAIIRNAAGAPTLECLCGTVLCGRTDPALPCFTAAGSFWCNGTTELLATPCAKERLAHARNACNRAGYESVALIPLRAGDAVLGLLQLNDRRRQRFTPEVIEFFEDLCLRLGMALAHRRAERELQQSEARYRSIVEDQSELICRYRPDGRLSFVNDAYARYYGRSHAELIDRNFIPEIPAADMAMIAGRLATITRERPAVEFTHRIVMPGGKTRWQQWTHRGIYAAGGALTEYQAVGRDITERKQVQIELACLNQRLEHLVSERTHELEMANAQLRHEMTEHRRALEELQASERKSLHFQQLLNQAERLATLGTLVAGVAHEISNHNHYALENAAVMSGLWQATLPILDLYARENGSFLLMNLAYPEQKEAIGSLLQGIENGTRRTSHIVAELKNLACHRPGTANEMTELVDLNAVAASTVSLTASMRGKATECFVTQYRAELPPVRGSYQRLEQVLINLIQNACRALTDPRQVIRLTTDYDAAENRVLCHVQDEGVGILPEHRQRLFEPFFTTHADRGGFGLGLPLCEKIVKEHGGIISISSTPARGTTVSVSLPAHGEAPRQLQLQLG